MGRAQEHDRGPGVARESAPGSPKAARDTSQAGVQQATPLFPRWLGRLGYYGLALLFVAIAATVRWALGDVLSPTPGLVFYLAWVGAAAFGGLGPGLLATLASWWCIGFLFDSPPWQVGFGEPASIARISIFLAGGLAVSVVGERMRRARIRERRQRRELVDANAALRASEEKYRFLVENSKDITWTIDLQGTWTFISGNVEQVTGYRADELIGKILWDFLAPESHDLVKEKLRRRVRGEDLPPYEVMFVGKDGRHMPFEVLAASIVDDGGSIVGVQGVARDITERKRAEEALRESEQRYRGIVEDQTELICLFEGDATITFVNDAYCRYFDKKREELVGHKFLSLIAEEDRESVEAKIAALNRESPFVTLEERVRRPDGSIAWQEWKNRAVFDGQGHLIGYQAVGRDITERKRAEEAVAESRKKYRRLVEKINDWVWEIDANGVYTYSSPRALELLGYPPEEIVGKTPFDLMPPAEAQRVWNAFQPIWLERRPLELLDNTLVRKDGGLVTVETSGMPVFAEDGAFLGYTGIDRDVTARKWAEEQLRRSEQDLNRAQAVAQTGSWRLDVRRNELLWSNETHRIFGIPTGTPMTYETFLAAVHPADQEYVDRQWTAALRGEPYDIEHRIVVDGQLKWVRERAELEFDEEGTLLGGFGTVQDITERKQAEQDLSESRNKYQALIETTADFIWEMDTSGKYTYCSPQMKGLWGYEPKDMIGKTPFDVMPPEDRKQAIGSFMSLAKSPKPFTGLEASSYDSRGRLIAVEISGVPFFDADGRLLGYRGISRDVTERKRAEEALRASQSMLQSVMENVPQGIFWKDRHSTYLGCNKVFVKAVGLESARDIIGKTDYDLPWSPEQTASFREYDRRIMENDAPEYHIIEQMREADGRLTWVETNKAPLHNAQGQVIGILGTYEDITERKQAEQALRQAKTFTDKLLNAPLDTVFLFEPVTGKPVRWNKRFAEVSGYDDEEIAGMKAPDDFYDEDDIKKAQEGMGRILADGQGVVAMSLITKQGVHIPFEYAATVVEAEDGKTLFLSIGRDITERKRAEEALRELNATLESKVAERTAELQDRAKQLQKLTLELTEAENRERKRLAEILHDDLQQILAAAKFHLGLVSNQYKDNETLQEMTGQVKGLLVEAIDKSRRLSRELSPPGLAQSDLRETFEWLASQVQAKHGLTVHVDVRDQIELQSEPLKALLYKAAQEMLFNVVKHAQVREARLRLRRRRGNICLAVSDKGRGFDPREAGKTTGFGLLNIRERLNLLGGRMKVRSAKGKGSTFLIIVPDSPQQTGQTDHL